MTDAPIAVEVNCETGIVTERPLTADEIAAQAEAQVRIEADAQVKANADAAKAAAKEVAIAKLAAIGLTADDVAALLG